MNPGDTVRYIGRKSGFIPYGTIAELMYYIGREAVIKVTAPGSVVTSAVDPWDIEPTDEPI